MGALVATGATLPFLFLCCVSGQLESRCTPWSLLYPLLHLSPSLSVYIMLPPSALLPRAAVVVGHRRQGPVGPYITSSTIMPHSHSRTCSKLVRVGPLCLAHYTTLPRMLRHVTTITLGARHHRQPHPGLGLGLLSTVHPSISSQGLRSPM